MLSYINICVAKEVYNFAALSMSGKICEKM